MEWAKIIRIFDLCSWSIIEKICIIIVYVMARSQQAKVAFVTIIVTCQSSENIIIDTIDSEKNDVSSSIIYWTTIYYNQPITGLVAKTSIHSMRDYEILSVAVMSLYYSMFYLLHDDAVLK